MIQSFRDERTRSIWDGNAVRSLPQQIQQRARAKLRTLDQTTDLLALRVPPGNRFEALVGSRRGEYSIRINQQWRIVFRWEGDLRAGNASDVLIEDYH